MSVSSADRGSLARRVVEIAERFASAALEGVTTDHLLQRVVEMCIDVAAADSGVARIRDETELRIRAAVGLDSNEAEELVSAVDPQRFAAESHAGVRCVSTTISNDRVRSGNFECVHSVPLRGEAAVLGIIDIACARGHQLSADEEWLLALLARMIVPTLLRQEACDSLKRGVQARDEVLTTVAHDLQNPLNVIALSAGHLLRSAPDTSMHRSAERIARAAQRAGRLVQDLLDMDAIEKGRFVVNRRNVDVAAVVRSALESQQGPAAAASVALSSTLTPLLPRVECDEERVLEVLENLVGNAIKFTTSGSSITLGARAEGDHVLLWVQDDGRGIPPEDLPRVFERYWRADRKGRHGSGLGLAICKGIVEAHGGRIWAESVVAKGTTIFFTLPAATARLSAEPHDAPRILIVDDRRENLTALEAILDRPDYVVVSARSAEQALNLVSHERFSLALIDIRMPDMSGIDLAVRLKQLEFGRDMPIIFVTGLDNDPELIRMAYDAGGADYLVKPIDPEIVRKKVAIFVELGRKRA